MWAGRAICILALTLAGMSVACGRQSPLPMTAAASSPAIEPALPFAREAKNDGISPSSAVIPPGAHVPTGTLIKVRLQTRLTSASSKTEDRFKAQLDEPIVLNDVLIADRGAVLTGRVVEARSIKAPRTPGYLRLTLSAIYLEGKPVPIRTSSTFLKGVGPRRPHTLTTGTENIVPILGNAVADDDESTPTLLIRPREISVGPERRLTFRLIEPLPIQP
jgi:hypothetical protein